MLFSDFRFFSSGRRRGKRVGGRGVEGGRDGGREGGQGLEGGKEGKTYLIKASHSIIAHQRLA